jgi:hypothetical protein
MSGLCGADTPVRDLGAEVKLRLQEISYVKNG